MGSPGQHAEELELVQELEGDEDEFQPIQQEFPFEALNRIQQSTAGFPAGLPMLSDLVACSDASVNISMIALRAEPPSRYAVHALHSTCVLLFLLPQQ